MAKVSPAQRPHYRQVAPGISQGIKFSKKAGMWCFYIHKNSDKADVLEWFKTQEEAVNRLTEAMKNV